MTVGLPAQEAAALEGIDPAARIEFAASPNFGAWLKSVNASLAATAYLSSKIVFIGRSAENDAVAVSQGTFLRCMGLGVHPGMRSLTISTKHELVRFENLLPAGQLHEDHDAIFAPHRTWVTGFLDVHDLAMMPDKSLLFVNTVFSCLATVTDGYSFKPVWQPPFISELLPEDRCHLNGMAVEGNQPRFVTAVSETNTEKGWQEKLLDGGVLIDVPGKTILLRDLSMPHSPRIHGGRLWMLEAGRGAFGYVDLAARRFMPMTFCPGFARGLAMIGNYAVICLSLPRSDQKNFNRFELGTTLNKRGEKPLCGLMVVDIRTGETVASLEAKEGARELFDVAVLPGIRNPKVIDFSGDEIDRMTRMDLRP